MAKYTIELRNLFEPLYYKPALFTREEVENFFKEYNLSDYLTNEQINVINESGYWSKDKLAKKIVDHYYMREIGFETPALFRHYAKIKMQELMEYYLPLIYSRAIKYDPLVNVDFTETFDRKASDNSSGNSNSSSNSSGSSLGISSDTPQGQVDKTSILSGKYASSTGANENETNVDSNTTSESQSNNEEFYTRRTKGNSGVSATAQKMVEQFRDNIRAIDSEIIAELNILFMGLY